MKFVEKIKNKFSRIKENKNSSITIRKVKDLGINFTTLISSCFVIGILIWMIVYVFVNGTKYLSLDFITSDYSSTAYTIKTKDDFSLGELTFENKENAEYFSTKWGVGFKDQKQNEENVIYIASLDEKSPFSNLVDSKYEHVTINQSCYLSSLALLNKTGDLVVVSGKDGAQKLVEELDNSIAIYDGTLTKSGQGIKGSLLTTFALIGFSLLFSLPLGIGGAIYLAIYARDNFFTKTIRTLIDVTSGIPSIIFGLAGAIIFIPFTNSLFHTTGGNIFSGSLTLAIMLLPTIVKTTEESINVIPRSLKEASLALGASETQTVFKVVIPNSLPGILTATLLSIGRIIGESAALIFSMGAIIGDNINLLGGNASLAVHIWVALQGETPQYGNACAISIIILITMLVLSLIIKLISRKLNKFKGAN